MNYSLRQKLLLTGVILLLLAAGILTGLLPSTLADGRRRLDRKRLDLIRLTEIRQIADHQAALQAVFTRLEASRATPLESILRTAAPGIPYDLRELEQGPASTGWRWERVGLNLMGISERDLIRLVGALEKERPPWKAVALNIHSGSQTGQVSQVSLTLETLIRTTP